jgi:hypothetical protein
MMCKGWAADAVVVLGQVGGLPAQVRQRPGEVHGVLAGAAADLEDVAAVGEVLAQDGEDGVAVAVAGGGVWAVHGLCIYR